MPNLLDLSPELMEAILDILAPDSPALDNLCLAGNHNLLALARPYTWRELNITLSSFEHKGAERAASSALASRFEAFYADPVKTAAARSLNIKLAGIFHSWAPAFIRKIPAIALNEAECFTDLHLVGVTAWGWHSQGDISTKLRGHVGHGGGSREISPSLSNSVVSISGKHRINFMA
ncbi:hypothetical protein C8J57DRAFT_1217585 [Mycena rebaudengoi]|nr:hypothetical protein C8J57DRAFT_1217585 [Mycena rebaudengoi]